MPSPKGKGKKGAGGAPPPPPPPMSEVTIYDAMTGALPSLRTPPLSISLG